MECRRSSPKGCHNLYGHACNYYTQQLQVSHIRTILYNLVFRGDRMQLSDYYACSSYFEQKTCKIQLFHHQKDYVSFIVQAHAQLRFQFAFGSYF